MIRWKAASSGCSPPLRLSAIRSPELRQLTGCTCILDALWRTGGRCPARSSRSAAFNARPSAWAFRFLQSNRHASTVCVLRHVQAAFRRIQFEQPTSRLGTKAVAPPEGFRANSPELVRRLPGNSGKCDAIPAGAIGHRRAAGRARLPDPIRGRAD